MIPEERYKLLMQNSEVQSQLADKNVIVFRGSAKDAIDMQLCKMGIVPYTTNAYDESKKNEGISKKFIDGLAEISESVGRPGLEHVAYKGIGGTGEGNRYHYNEQMNKHLEALSKKEFFDFLFTQNPSVSHLKEKLLEDARQILFTDDSLELYSNIGYGSEQTEIINEIRNILGVDRISETIVAYNEKATLAYEQRHKKFIDSLPELKTEQLHTNTQQQLESIETDIGINIIGDTEPITNHDADRLDIDIENPEHQRFQVGRLNDSQNAELISAVIELNTRQAINKGYLQIKDGKVCLNEKSKIRQEQNSRKIFEEGSLDSELQQLSSETTMSGFNEMSQNIRHAQRLNEQEQTLEDTKVYKEDEGWDVNDD